MVRCFVIAAAATLLLGSTLRAEDIPEKTTIQAGYGTVTIGGVQWQRFSFRPDVPIGRFGIGLDLELFIDNNGKISDEGWDFSSKSRTWDTMLRKIYYVRYGKTSDRFHARAGALDDVTLGYGLIMDGYRNTLNYPGDKKLGLEFGVSDIGTFGLGVEGMVNSFGDLQNKGAVVGVRTSARPLKPADIPLLSKLTFGVTFVRDINQYAGLKDSDNDGYPDFEDGFPNDKNHWYDTDHDGISDYKDDNKPGMPGNYNDPDADGDGLTDYLWDLGDHGGFDNNVDYAQLKNTKNDKNGVTEWGLDAGIPVLEGPVSLDVYGQYAKIHKIHTAGGEADGGWGTAIPGVQLTVSRFLGRVEYRHFEGRFRPKYFDHLYENERATYIGNTIITKGASLQGMTLNGVYGMARYNFFEMLRAEATYQNMTGDQTLQDLTGKIKVLDRVLEHIPKITIAEGYYYNTYVNTGAFDLLDITGNTLYGTRIGISLTQGLTIVWDTHYTFTPKVNGGFERNRFVGIETVMTVR